MTAFRFKDFVFEHNPRKIELSFSNRIAAHTLPAFGALLQNLGARGRTVRCEGEVFASTADGAAGKLSAIASACSGMEAGTLSLPTGESFQAFAVRFGYCAQGDGKIISYYAEFAEKASGGNA